MNITSAFGAISQDQLLDRIIEPTQKSYVHLFTRYAEELKNDDGQTYAYRWYYSANQDVTNSGFSSYKPIRDITSIRLLTNIMPLTALNEKKRYSILIEEFATQASIISQTRRAHWILRPQYIKQISGIDDSQIAQYQIGPFNGQVEEENIYYFHTPITVLNTITISMGNPDQLITWSKLKSNVVSWNIPSPAATEITLDEPHGFTVGTATYIKFVNFTTLDPATDAEYITLLNRDDLLASVISTTSFRLSGDLATLVTPDPTLQCEIRFITREMTFPLEITHKVFN